VHTGLFDIYLYIGKREKKRRMRMGGGRVALTWFEIMCVSVCELCCMYENKRAGILIAIVRHELF
jgi:hypothetical protein